MGKQKSAWDNISEWRMELKLASPEVPSGSWFAIRPTGEGDGTAISASDWEALGVFNLNECTVLDSRGGLPRISAGIQKYQQTNDLIRDIQRMYSLIQQFQGDAHIQRFIAAMEYEDCVFLWEAVEIGEHLDAYSFLSTEDFRATVKRDLMENGIEERILNQCFDFNRYAALKYQYEDLYTSIGTGLYVHKVDESFQINTAGPQMGQESSGPALG